MSSRRPVLAIVTDSIHPFFAGGKEIRYFELSQRLAAEFDVHVHTMKWWPEHGSQTRGNVELHAICPRADMYVAGGRRSIVQALLFALGCLRLLWARFDVLEADHMPYLHLFVLRLVCWVRRRRMVVTWHEVWGREYWRSYLGPAGLVAYLVELTSMRLPDAILAASDQTRERLQRVLGPNAPVHAAPNGLDLATIRATVPSPHTTDIVTVGRLIPHKRIDLVLQAVADLKRDHGPVRCRIIGTGPERERLLEEIRRLDLADHVELRSDVTETSELISLVKAARVFVLASEREGFGIAALEGLACGLPVITTSARDNLAQYLVGSAPNGVVCAPTHESLAKEIHAVLATESEHAEHDALERWIAAYSWPVVTELVAAVLQDASRSRR